MADRMRTEQLVNTKRKLSRILLSTALIVLFGTTCRRSAEAQIVQPDLSVYTNAEEFSYEQGVEAQAAFSRDVSDMLKARRFDELDALAKKLRTTKAQWPGSRWKLRDFYIGLQDPRPKMHSTEVDWAEHLKLLNKWVAERPKSITGYVALAGAYIAYGWDARGEKYSETVTDSGWKLFAERLAKAKSVLLEAKKLEEKCPQWYATMQYVAQGESWSREQERGLFEEAVAFEPMYHEYYHNVADYLLPRWHGEPGDTERFAEAAANGLGGAEGDILYFQIGYAQICFCENEDVVKAMSWPRIQKGYAESERLYGKSLMRINQIALIAARLDDALVADDAFRRMGSRWSHDVWTKESYFGSIREWVAAMAPVEREKQKMQAEVKQNMTTPDGQRHRDEVAQVLGKHVAECSARVDETSRVPLHALVRLKADGTPNGMMINPFNDFSRCLMGFGPELEHGKYTPAPKDGYWIAWDVDPKAVK
jgi:hypothetical protein